MFRRASRLSELPLWRHRHPREPTLTQPQPAQRGQEVLQDTRHFHFPQALLTRARLRNADTISLWATFQVSIVLYSTSGMNHCLVHKGYQCWQPLLEVEELHQLVSSIIHKYNYHKQSSLHPSFMKSHLANWHLRIFLAFFRSTMYAWVNVCVWFVTTVEGCFFLFYCIFLFLFVQFSTMTSNNQPKWSGILLSLALWHQNIVLWSSMPFISSQ